MIFKLFVLWNCKLKKYFQNWFMLSVIFPHILAEKWSWSWSCNWSRSLPVILIFFQWSWSLSWWSLIFDLDQKISDLLQLWWFCTRSWSSAYPPEKIIALIIGQAKCQNYSKHTHTVASIIATTISEDTDHTAYFYLRNVSFSYFH